MDPQEYRAGIELRGTAPTWQTSGPEFDAQYQKIKIKNTEYIPHDYTHVRAKPKKLSHELGIRVMATLKGTGSEGNGVSGCEYWLHGCKNL